MSYIERCKASARRALAAGTDCEDERTDVVDLLAHLMHLSGDDFDDRLRVARNHAEAERDEEDPCPDCGEPSDDHSHRDAPDSCPRLGERVLDEATLTEYEAPDAVTCTGCGRPEPECSAAPCPDVIADREEVKP